MFKSLLLERHLTHAQAAFYAILAYFLFAMCDGMGKWLMEHDYDKTHIFMVTNFPSLIVLTTLMIRRKGLGMAYYTPYPLYHVIRGLSLIGVTFFVFESIHRIPLADFYGINFSAPFIITLGAVLLFKEKTSLTEWLCIITGFAGVLIIAGVGFEGTKDYTGYIYAMLATLCLACAALSVRKIGREEDPHLFVIFANIAILAFNIIPALTTPLPQVISMHHIAVMAIYACTIPTAILTLSAVFARAPSVASVTPFLYLQIVWGALFGFLVFGDIPELNVIIGSLIVIACGLYIIFHHKRNRRQRLPSP